MTGGGTPTVNEMTSGILVIFGVTGDLSRRYLLPALYHLAVADLLPDHFEIIGITRRKLTPGDILTQMQIEYEKDNGPLDPAGLSKLRSKMRIITMDMTKPSDYASLKQALDHIEDEHKTCLNRLFYLSIPPSTYSFVVEQLGAQKLNSGCQHGVADSRLMVEKPFGYDLESARQLIDVLKSSFTESQIYRIDHYLAKETAQNILVFRFSNPIFLNLWDNRWISSLTITASESIGIEGRGVFYDPIGALRDFVQSHLLQLLALVTMDQPRSMDSSGIHASKLKLLKSIKPVRPDEVSTRAKRGQYKGYPAEVKNPGSITETFAQLSLEIDTKEWRSVPVILRTGKKLDRKYTDIDLVFSDPSSGDSNTLTFRIQPNEGISIDLLAKRPGLDNKTEHVEMAFNYGQNFAGAAPNAYERVLMDGIRGDQTLFSTSDEVIVSWEIVDQVVRRWSKDGDGLVIYEGGETIDEVARQF
jgi:glucose-6-phosphate 1-dehydrogenase